MSRDSITRAGRQQLQTYLLLGVDFVPQRAAGDVAVEGPSEEASAPIIPMESAAPQRIAVASDRAALLESLREEHSRTCPHCTSCTGYTNIVFGEGNPEAEIMFIGEAPGEEEDRTGRPFVGRAGQKLDEIIRAMGLARSQVYIANVLKVRPPNNRAPLPEEALRCGPYLRRQIAAIGPKVIVAMGGPATKYLLDARDGITRIRGSWLNYRDGDVEIPVMPTFHPAYLLRNYTRDTRQKVWADMQEVMSRVGLTT